jgi:hypothetical protein
MRVGDDVAHSHYATRDHVSLLCTKAVVLGIKQRPAFAREIRTLAECLASIVEDERNL